MIAQELVTRVQLTSDQAEVTFSNLPSVNSEGNPIVSYEFVVEQTAGSSLQGISQNGGTVNTSSNGIERFFIKSWLFGATFRYAANTNFDIGGEVVWKMVLPGVDKDRGTNRRVIITSAGSGGWMDRWSSIPLTESGIITSLTFAGTLKAGTIYTIYGMSGL